MGIKLSERLHKRILEVPGIEFKKSRFKKTEAYFLGSREIAHFHDANEIDIRVTRKEITKGKWRDGSNPLVHVRSPSSDWAEVSFGSANDLDLVIDMVKLAKRANRTK